jgi:RND family efflux transporter MFP subunit
MATLLVLSACGGGAQKSGEGADSTAANSQTGADSTTSSQDARKNEKAIRVDVAEVRRSDLVIPIFADGVIRTTRSVQVRTKVAGELVRVFVEDGDQVASGQLLAQIDQREFVLALEESRYRHFQALAQAAAEEETLSVNGEALTDFTERRQEIQRLHRQGKLSGEEYRAQLLNLQMAALQGGAFRQEMFEQRTGLGEARLAEERAKLNLEHTEIRAPFSGTVEGLAIARGEIVSVNAPICTIVNSERLEASVNVLESDLGNLVEGRPALIGIPATGDTIRARVDVISPLLDEISRTCQVLLRFGNPEGRFRPGMFVRAEIAGWIHPDKLLVPKPAVLTRDDRPLVFKVNEDQAQWLYIETGLENEEWVEIVNVFSGGSLAPGDRVVVSDHLTLAHEAKIRIRRTRSLEDRWGLEGETSS